MFLSRRSVIAALGAASVTGCASSAPQTESRLPLISTTTVYSLDPVEAKNGRHVQGAPASALRTGRTVRMFASDANRSQYVLNPAGFPDVGSPLSNVASFGFDATERFPAGVYSPAEGAKTLGLVQNALNHKEARFLFAKKETREAFTLFSDRYVTAVGGYCLGALSLGRITPGDPNNALFIPELGEKGMWAVFGSPNGPKVWAGMPSDKRRIAIAAAEAHYKRLTTLA